MIRDRVWDRLYGLAPQPDADWGVASVDELSNDAAKASRYISGSPVGTCQRIFVLHGLRGTSSSNEPPSIDAHT